MPISSNGILVGAALDRRREPGQDTPHYQVRVRAGQADLPRAQRWVAVFLAFQSQSCHTDDATGHRLDQPVEQPIQVVAALVHRPGGAPEPETVTLLTASPPQRRQST